MSQAPAHSTDRLMRLPAVLAATGYSRSGLYHALSTGSFPRTVKVGRIAAWPESEVRRWIEARKQERSAA